MLPLHLHVSAVTDLLPDLVDPLRAIGGRRIAESGSQSEKFHPKPAPVDGVELTGEAAKVPVGHGDTGVIGEVGVQERGNLKQITQEEMVIFFDLMLHGIVRGSIIKKNRIHFWFNPEMSKSGSQQASVDTYQVVDFSDTILFLILLIDIIPVYIILTLSLLTQSVFRRPKCGTPNDF